MAFENIDTKKFEGLFTSMERQLVMQTSFMESMYNIAVEEREDRKDRENLLDVMRKEEFSFQGPEDAKLPSPKERDAASALSSFFGLIPGILSSISLSGIGSLLVTGGLIGLVAPAIGDFVEGLTKKALDDISIMGFELPEGFASGLSSALGDATQWGVIGKLVGRIFGKKIGALVTGTGFIFEQVNKYLDPDQNGAIESGFLEGFNPDAIAGIGAALSAALALALPKLISRSLPGILGGLALPAITPPNTPQLGPTKEKVTASPGRGLNLKSLGKAGAGAGILFGLLELSETGDLGVAAASGTGATVGGIVGGVIGSLGGPIGTAIGAAIGSTIGDYLGREALEYARTPVSEAGEPFIGSLNGPVAGAPNRMDAFNKNFVPDEPALPLTPQQIADNELAIAQAEAFSIPMEAYQETVIPKKEETKPLPYFLSDTNAIISKAIKSYTDKIAPDGNVSFAIDQERIKRLDLISRDANENAKAHGTTMNSFSAPTIGGATNNNDNRTTIINQLSQPSSALDRHYILQ